MTRAYRVLLLTATLGMAAGLSACATRPAPVAAVVAPPPPPPVALPAGTYPGMPVPAQLSDGSYATPNRSLSPAASVWHLRAGLNFAALACRGPAESAIIAGYNAMLAAQKPVLAAAERSLTGEYRGAGGDWRDAYDDAMTRLYNYYALSAARPALCDTAARLLAEAPGVPPQDFAAFAAARLPELDRSITDVYRGYDAWRAQRPVVYAITANAPVAQGVTQGLAQGSAQGPRVPWIEVDPAVLRLP